MHSEDAWFQTVVEYHLVKTYKGYTVEWNLCARYQTWDEAAVVNDYEVHYDNPGNNLQNNRKLLAS